MQMEEEELLKSWIDELERYYPCIDVSEPYFSTINPQSLPIWSMWAQGTDKLTPLSFRCLRSVDSFAQGREFGVLTLDNLHAAQLDLPEFILEKHAKGIISHTHLSDIVRLCLLEKYGVPGLTPQLC